MEEKPKETKDSWMRMTFILLILSLIIITFGAYFGLGDSIFEPKSRQETIEGKMCMSISGTPAWADINGTIIDYGYTSFNSPELFETEKHVIVDALINEGIYFLYHQDCVHCQNQIKWFNYSWNSYKESGYAVDCGEFW